MVSNSPRNVLPSSLINVALKACRRWRDQLIDGVIVCLVPVNRLWGFCVAPRAFRLKPVRICRIPSIALLESLTHCAIYGGWGLYFPRGSLLSDQHKTHHRWLVLISNSLSKTSISWSWRIRCLDVMIRSVLLNSSCGLCKWWSLLMSTKRNKKKIRRLRLKRRRKRAAKNATC